MAAAGNSGGRTSRRARRGPTVADVARLAQVSAMTVSRVVNGEGNVVLATRERVSMAIRELGYVPNPAARNLAAGRQCCIALLHSNPSAAYLSEFLMGALAEASASGAQLVVEHCSTADSAADLVARLRSHRADAVLLPPPLCDDALLLAALRKAGLPMAQVATGVPAPFAHAVSIDDHAAARDVTHGLIALGHRRIGFIRGDANQSASALRFAGYCDALSAAGLRCDDSLVATGDFTYRSGLEAATRLLALPERPTAIFASNDDMAAAAVSAAHRAGLDVPGDLSVCGFDDTPIATTVWPEITTARQPIAEMARRATRLLMAAIAAPDTAPAIGHERLEFEHIQRGSSGPPRQT